MKPIPVLSIAGLDPSAGAGILADMRVFNAMGLYGTAAATAITAQNTAEVREVFPLAGSEVEAQIQTLLTDMKPAASKTGMLAAGETVAAVARFAATGSLGRLVVDPVLAASSGVPLAEDEMVRAMTGSLLAHCDLVTPNIAEAALISGVDVVDRESALAAAEAIRDMGAAAVCITGGHWQGAPADLLVTGEETILLEGTRIGGKRGFHGSGCLFSAAAAAFMALGEDTVPAVRKAKDFTGSAIAASVNPGGGMRIPWAGGRLEQRDTSG